MQPEQMGLKNKNKFNHKGWLKGIGISILVLALILYLGLPAVMGIAAVLPTRAAVGQPPQGFEAVSLRAEDGVTLQAWYRPAANGRAIILLHGAGGSRASVRAYAEMLASHAYGVLAVDLRGHGESEGKTNRLGWKGSLDVGAAVDFLLARGEVQSIGWLGTSMGAEVLLGAAARYPSITAMVADGATRRSIDELLALESERPLVRNFTARVMFTTVRLLSGESPPQPLLDAMLEAESTHFLFIAAGSTAQEVAFNELFLAALGNRAALWIAPETKHVQAFRQYPGEYEQRVIEFFDAALSGTPTP
jgi:pimeloyl-ACP methyl ester carboxylesterase